MAVRGDENVRERHSVSRWRTGIGCDWESWNPSVSKTINVCEAKMSEKCDSQERRKRNAKEVQDFDEFEVKVTVVKSETRITPVKKVFDHGGESRSSEDPPPAEDGAAYQQRRVLALASSIETNELFRA